MGRDHPESSRGVDHDSPPYSRIFVVFNRYEPLSEIELSNEFSPFGEIEDLFIVNDKKTGESKGIAFIKYSKMSEAAKAVEVMDNTPVKDRSGTLKVTMAKSREELKNGNDDDPDRYSRLYVTLPKTSDESELKEHYSKFGSVKSIKLLRNRGTNDSRGMAYVTFYKISDAAKAIEAEDEDEESLFRAVVARPKENKYQVQESSNGPSRSVNHREYMDDAGFPLEADNFIATVSAKLNADQLYQLFDIAPGLIDVKIISRSALRADVEVRYKSLVAAEYAISKINGLEYPLGDAIRIGHKRSANKRKGDDFRLEATDTYSKRRMYQDDMYDERPTSSRNPVTTEVHETINNLQRALAEARSFLGSSVISNDDDDLRGHSSYDRPSRSEMDLSPSFNRSNNFSNTSESVSRSSSVGTKSLVYCDFPLPPRRNILSKSEFNEATGLRLFFVGNPSAPPYDILEDLFCRFDNFAGVSIERNKNFGYVYYCSKESAMKAIREIDDKVIAGMTLKVLVADPKGTRGSKRRRGK